MSLSAIGEKIFKLKYATSEKETWEDACLRVAQYIASAEEKEEQIEWTAKFFQAINDLVFLPGGRILANAGTTTKNLMNCFVLPVEDSRTSIYKSLSLAAEIFAQGGGIGYNFSKLREEGAKINTTGGKSSGPLSFMGQYDFTGEVIQQASRRGAQMGMLHVSHPDIFKFIKHKSRLSPRHKRILSEVRGKLGLGVAEDNIKSLGYKVDKLDFVNTLRKTLADNQLTHFNLSVILTDKFMKAVEANEDWDLVSPSTGEVVSTTKARLLFRTIAKRAWESGDPGVFFIDRANEDNMVKYIGDIESTNPCGEVPLLPYEACCLGSLNLTSFYDEGTNTINWEFLEYSIRLAIRFLDNVQTMSITGINEIDETSKNLRRLGLGVMGWADLLALMEIPYDNQEALDLARKLSWFITLFSWSESLILVGKGSPFNAFDAKCVDMRVINKVLSCEFTSLTSEELAEMGEEVAKVRNVSVTSIAPTGSIALLAGVNSSIEPFYGLAYTRNMTAGVGNVAKDTILETNPILLGKLEELKLTNEEIGDILKTVLIRGGTLSVVPNVPKNLRDVFKTAHEISWKDHIKMQAAWQDFVTNAVSKTINMPNSTTIQEVEEAFMAMWKAKLKGGTIYRDGSKAFQILTV